MCYIVVILLYIQFYVPFVLNINFFFCHVTSLRILWLTVSSIEFPWHGLPASHQKGCAVPVLCEPLGLLQACGQQESLNPRLQLNYHRASSEWLEKVSLTNPVLQRLFTSNFDQIGLLRPWLMESDHCIWQNQLAAWWATCLGNALGIINWDLLSASLTEPE